MSDAPASQDLAAQTKDVPGIDGTPVSDQGSLTYPFDGRPGDGEVMEMRPGVLRLRMPLPIPGLDFINLWLIEETEGWTLVDTGVKSSKLQKIWDEVVARHLKGNRSSASSARTSTLITLAWPAGCSRSSMRRCG